MRTTRALLLFEGTDQDRPTHDDARHRRRRKPDDGTLAWDERITEKPQLDDVEIWEIYNSTADAHPIHLHLVAFQVLDRQKFTATVTPKDHGDGVGGVLASISCRASQATRPKTRPAGRTR